MILIFYLHTFNTIHATVSPLSLFHLDNNPLIYIFGSSLNKFVTIISSLTIININHRTLSYK